MKFVEVFLDGYYAFRDSEDVNSRDMVLDITNAIKKAPLTTKEKLVLAKLYFSGPQSPVRDRLDKNGSTTGRPPGGATTITVARELNMDFRRVSEIKQSAIQKIAEQLGQDYGI